GGRGGGGGGGLLPVDDQPREVHGLAVDAPGEHAGDRDGLVVICRHARVGCNGAICGGAGQRRHGEARRCHGRRSGRDRGLVTGEVAVVGRGGGDLAGRVIIVGEPQRPARPSHGAGGQPGGGQSGRGDAGGQAGRGSGGGAGDDGAGSGQHGGSPTVVVAGGAGLR